MKNPNNQRKGSTLIIVAILLPSLAVVFALVLELSRLRFIKNQMQTAADAGALAGAAELRHFDSSLVSNSFSLDGFGLDKVRPTVRATVSANKIAHLGPESPQQFVVEENLSNAGDGDIVLGTCDNLGIFSPSLTNVNAVRVVTRFGEGHSNNQLSLFFSTLLQVNFVNLKTSACARVDRPTLVPFIIYQPQWNALLSGNGVDNFAVNNNTNAVSAGSDGILETTIFPGDWDGMTMPPGNFGWFDLSPDTGTDTICRLLQQGPSSSDMLMFNGRLKGGDLVSGVTGIKAGTEAAIVGGSSNGKSYESILGKPKIFALYDLAGGDGTNATFRITKFVVGRIVAADLSGSSKAVVIQPITTIQNPNRVRLMQ